MNLLIDNRYSVVRPIGAGGMADVFHAVDTVLGRSVAIKLVRPAIVRAQEGLDRFLIEARLVARLQHPGVVSVYDVGITEDGRPYLVMELFLEGTLAELLGRGTLTPDEVAHVLAEAAEALQAVHDAGIIHRDIKPSNIALGSTGSEKPRVKILDFGIARLLKSDDEESIVGTPLYMSPEQIMGHDLGPWTDIYTLGLVAYEALAGRPPIAGHLGIPSILAKRVSEAAEPLDPSVPPQLAALVMDMLQLEPTRRPPSMAEVARRARQAIAETIEKAR